MEKIISAIHDANLTRNVGNIGRRVIKLSEEVGEHAEAYLNITSLGNGKGKTWDDVREESADMVIVAVDVALTGHSETELLSQMLDIRGRQSRGYQHYEAMTLFASVMVGDLNKALLASEDHLPASAGAAMASLDLALTALPDQADWSQDDLMAQLEEIVSVKLAKWRRNRDTGTAASDAE